MSPRQAQSQRLKTLAVAATGSLAIANFPSAFVPGQNVQTVIPSEPVNGAGQVKSDAANWPAATLAFASAAVAAGAVATGRRATARKSTISRKAAAAVSLADAIVEEPELTVLLSALQKASLVDTLGGSADFTVFAPSDKAFFTLSRKLGCSMKALLENPNLKDILLYHVSPGTVTSKDLKDLQKLPTAQGNQLLINAGRLFEGRVQVNKSIIETSDHKVCSNGVIHIINDVLLPPPKVDTIAATASSNNKLKTLVSAIKQAGLAEAVSNPGELTVLAPNDAAFDQACKNINFKTKDLLASPHLKGILLNHVIPKTAMSNSFLDNQLIKTLGTREVKTAVDRYNGTVHFNQALVIKADTTCTNGVIHILDKVLLPTIAETAVANGSFKTLVAALQKTHLVEAVNGKKVLTVFAPTDAAFEDLCKQTGCTLEQLLGRPDLKAILSHHVVAGASPSTAVAGKRLISLEGGNLEVSTDGKTVKVDQATVTAADIPCSNGIIHVIDKVLLPPTTASKIDNLAATLVADERCKILLKALEKVDLVSALSGDKEFTVFAPTDRAWTGLANKLALTVDEIMEREDLKKTLLNHVIKGTVYSKDLQDEMRAEMMSGSKLQVRLLGRGVRIANAEVTKADVLCTNGVIHYIDQVILNKK